MKYFINAQKYYMALALYFFANFGDYQIAFTDIFITQ